MPSARPSIDVTFTATIESGSREATSPTRPSVSSTASAPDTTGTTAAVTAPKAASSSASVTGSVRRSACFTSSALVRQMSWLIGPSPVIRRRRPGADARRLASSSSVTARRPGTSWSARPAAGSRPSTTNVPPPCPRNSVSVWSRYESACRTPRAFLSAATTFTRIARPSGRSGPGTPLTTSSAGTAKGEAKRCSSVAATAFDSDPTMRACASRRSSTRSACGTSSAVASSQAATRAAPRRLSRRREPPTERCYTQAPGGGAARTD